MAHKQIKGKEVVWWHFDNLTEKDFRTLEKQFKFHPLDFDDLRDPAELSKVDIYKYYLFSVLNVPVFNKANMQIMKRNLGIFIGKGYLVTATQLPIEVVDRLFERVKRNRGLKKDMLGQSSGYALYKLLDYVFRDSSVTLRELSRETEKIEEEVYDVHTRVTTKRLGILRRNVLLLRHMIEPQRVLIDQYVNAKKSFVPKKLKIYFDDVHDTLNSISIVTENLKQIVDGLFDVNEAFLSHRTNESLRWLTIISVVLMPPTLIASYYGMNVRNLPFANDILLVTVFILFSLIAFWILIMAIDRRK